MLSAPLQLMLSLEKMQKYENPLLNTQSIPLDAHLCFQSQLSPVLTESKGYDVIPLLQDEPYRGCFIAVVGSQPAAPREMLTFGS